MRPVNWGRLITAMLTPMDDRLEVNYPAVRQLAQHLADTGSDGVLVGGTTGESPTITRKERMRVLETVLDTVGDRVTVIAGTGSNSTADSVEVTREAELAGAHGVMLVTPYYNKPPQAGLVAHFSRIAAATRLPVMVYNVPGRTSLNMLPATVGRLAQVDNIVAVKESAGNLDQATEIVRAIPEGFRVYSGDDSLTLPIMSVGGYGIVSVASHVAGRQMKEMIQAYVGGDVARAAAIHRWLYPVVRALFMTTSPIPVKAAVTMIGIPAGIGRPPLCELTGAESETLRRALAEAGLLGA
jgi:4-hydroxy-tetrahydrodipicolinate synthase